MLTALENVATKVAAFRSGYDDFLTKGASDLRKNPGSDPALYEHDIERDALVIEMAEAKDVALLRRDRLPDTPRR